MGKAYCFYQNYREVRLLVIHCSATRYDRDFPVEALRSSHKARGFADIGYHFGSPDKPGGLSIQLCKSEKKEFYIRYSS